MLLLAIAGGAGPGDEGWLVVCAMFPILPLFVLLTGLAVFRNSASAAWLAVLLAGLPCALSALVVAGYGPTTDGDVLADQANGRRAVTMYTVLTVAAVLALIWVTRRQLAGGRVGIAGIPHSDVVRLHWNYGGGRGAVGLRHVPSGVTVARECPPGTPILQVLREVEVELAEKLRGSGAGASESGSSQEPA